jgi:hypothetical protein
LRIYRKDSFELKKLTQPGGILALKPAERAFEEISTLRTSTDRRLRMALSSFRSKFQLGVGSMRIVYVLTSLGMGGAEKQALAVADRMANRGHEVVLMVLKPRVSEEWPTAIRTVYLS